MSPAGGATAHYRDLRPGRYLPLALLLVALVGPFIIFSGARVARVVQAPVAALSPAWSEFQRDCTAGPSPGQGSTPQACLCWESHLQAEAIVPGYAVDELNAAQVGGGPAYTVPENLAGGPVGSTMAGCGLYGDSGA